MTVSVEQWRERWVGALQHSGIPIGLINGSVDPVSGVHMVERYREVLEAYLRFLRQL